MGYPLIEVVSSGVAYSKGRAELRTLSFATVDFDTTPADPTLRVRIVYGLPGSGFEEECNRLLREQGIETDHRGCMIGAGEWEYAQGYNYVMENARMAANQSRGRPSFR